MVGIYRVPVNYVPSAIGAVAIQWYPSGQVTASLIVKLTSVQFN